MHDEIRKFSLSGKMGEPNMAATKERLVHFIENYMRDYGYVPALDLDPQFTLNYDAAGEAFDFEISVYGVAVDKEKVWQTGGVMSGKTIPKYIPQTRLNQSSAHAILT